MDSPRLASTHLDSPLLTSIRFDYLDWTGLAPIRLDSLRLDSCDAAYT